MSNLLEPVQAFFRNTADRAKQLLPQDMKPPEFILLGTVCLLGVALLIILGVRGIAADPDPKNEPPTARGPVIAGEIPLGDFKYYLTDLQGGSAHKNHILEFEISVLVNAPRKDVLDLEDELRSFQHRIEQIVDQSARKAHLDELKDPASKKLRERIKKKINRLLGQPVVQDVVFSKFRFFSIPTTT